MSEAYRSDDRSRCSRCQTPTAYEDLALTVENERLCKSCQIEWAEEQRAKAGTEVGPRLVCPLCGRATMTLKGGEMVHEAVCQRCGIRTRRLQGASALLAALMLMTLAPITVLVTKMPALILPMVALVLGIAGYEIMKRYRFRKATFEEIESTDAELARDQAQAIESSYERSLRVGPATKSPTAPLVGAVVDAPAAEEGEALPDEDPPARRSSSSG